MSETSRDRATVRPADTGAPERATLPLLVSVEWLVAHLADPDLRVVDGSWFLPAEGRDARADYLAGHIPGAVHLDLATDLSDTGAPIRNTIASPAALAETFAAAGVGTDHRVVVYDQPGSHAAARIWWSLRYAGHSRCALLDGGLGAYTLAGHATTTELPRHARAVFHTRPRPELLAHKADVLRALADPGCVVIDARSAARFRGEGPEPAPRRGHMPGARNVPYTANMTSPDAGAAPMLRPVAELASLYGAAGAAPTRRVITTCGSGVTASLAAFALALTGRDDVAVYDGSWAEWAADEALPAALGDAPSVPEGHPEHSPATGASGGTSRA